MLFESARLLSRAVQVLVSYRMAVRTALLWCLVAGLWLFWRYSLFTSLVSVFVIYLVTGGWRFMKIIRKTFLRDMSAAITLIKGKRLMRKYKRSGQNMVTLFQETVRQNTDKAAFIMVDGRSWTFHEVDEYSNQVANYLHQAGYRAGNVIALFMENRPEYVFLWLGMVKIGVIPALINFNLRTESLVHCIKISEAKAIIFGTDLIDVMKDAKGMLSRQIYLYCFGDYNLDGLQATHLEPLILRASKMCPPKDHIIKWGDKLFYIYTSGTTGLPKAAIIINSRFYYMAFSVHNFFHMTGNEVVYNTLPLYHTAGGILGTGQALLFGCTVVIRKKFSASRFFEDCIKYNCTVVQYIGEICRYLLVQRPKNTDRQHRVWLAFGNGLRPQIWSQFTGRFSIAKIGEFYGATEGNANILNNDNTTGAVGFCSRIIPSAYPVTLIKVDETTGEIERDRNGMCIRCEPGEPGELVGKIIKGDAMREFDGYVDAEATKKKLAKNVFSRGDTAFLTGDILVMDEYGYMFFRDRTGDTFRWRGENVSTSEVEAQISNVLRLKDTVVYGVQIPGMEGRAGMVALVDEAGTINLSKFYTDLQRVLPAYAQPVFVRILNTMDVTGTFKIRKTDYKKEGFNPNVVRDPMYYLDTKAGSYFPIDKKVYEEITAGRKRL